MRRRAVAIVGLLLVILGLVTGVGLVALGLSRGDVDIHSIPIYPIATYVSTNDHSTSMALLPDQLGPGGIGTNTENWYHGNIDFFTTDSYQQVYAFYQSQLTNAGWVPDSASTTATTQAYIYRPALNFLPPWVPFLYRQAARLIISADYAGDRSTGVTIMMDKPDEP